MIRLIKKLIESYKRKKMIKKRLQEIRERDPFIYD